MNRIEKQKASRELQDSIYAIIWLLLTFLNIPYFLVAVNLEPSQFLLLDSIFVNIHPGIHHGLIGYITLSIGILGMRSSNYIEKNNLRNYLFLISFLFLIEGLYLSFQDLAYEQVLHTGFEETYIWSWKAPQAQFFPLIAFIPLIWMDNSRELFILMIPPLILSVFFIPYVSITAGYLIMISLTSKEIIRTHWFIRKEENWKLINRISWTTALFLGLSSAVLLFGMLVGI